MSAASLVTSHRLRLKHSKLHLSKVLTLSLVPDWVSHFGPLLASAVVNQQLQAQFLCGDLDRLAPKACSLRYDNDDQAGRSLRTQIADEILCFVA